MPLSALNAVRSCSAFGPSAVYGRFCPGGSQAMAITPSAVQPRMDRVFIVFSQKGLQQRATLLPIAKAHCARSGQHERGTLHLRAFWVVHKYARIRIRSVQASPRGNMVDTVRATRQRERRQRQTMRLSRDRCSKVRRISQRAPRPNRRSRSRGRPAIYHVVLRSVRARPVRQSSLATAAIAAAIASRLTSTPTIGTVAAATFGVHRSLLVKANRSCQAPARFSRPSQKALR